MKEKRGVAAFVPTRAEVEKLAASLGEQWPRLTTAFYHGGEPIRVIRPFLEDEVSRPFLLAMTAAGQSALNVRGLDTVVIYDARYGNVVDRGRNVLHRLYLGANEILQMAGRVHGRVPNGEVVILSDRDLVFEALRPTPPEFQLAGDAERVAITCAALGVDARDLDLPVPLDRTAYRRAVELLTRRGLVENGRLTAYGREVEALPVERPWGELVKAIEDIALGTASVYRSLELPLPNQLPYASKELRKRWADLLARYMPFDLVIDERTADGQDARISKTSVAGSWGAVVGNLRYFADRFGVPRASIEGTTLSYDLVRNYATLGETRVILGG